MKFQRLRHALARVLAILGIIVPWGLGLTAVLAGLAVLVPGLSDQFGHFSPSSLFSLIGLAVSLGLLVWFVGFLLLVFVVGAFFRLSFRLLNGGDLHEGDMVCVLVGPHRGRVARVHDVAKEVGRLRVELSPKDAGELVILRLFEVFRVGKEEAPGEAAACTGRPRTDSIGVAAESPEHDPAPS